MFVDESSFHLCTHHLKTFAPIGQTPVVKGKRGQSPRHLVIGAVSSEGRSYFHWTSDTVTGASIVAFLKTLLRYWPGKLRIIWDNAPVHRCQAVRDLLRHPEVQGRLRLEALPPYAPELNPAEAVWSWLKRRCANRAFSTALALGEWLRYATQWLKRRREQVKQLLRASPIH
ncbi:IS630 family transposase [Halomonas sp. M20]|uniref:IS630 family transposase n=1 Tax=Halomonas sp. M20 TaxID=2763264 RepID=UPI00261650F2|nr:IS630 family transposase [Halomonas sp. M20]